ncbi:hypothetical protein [Dendrosporobacter sp. 1207_IL3150]|uniref:hypothetical protein n=1 Tax=Dendrosporobacter sp. 1207_IL3150 TaxID=3084054 RepID=UPI002FD87FC7
MSELIITNSGQVTQMEPFIIEKLNTYGAGILDTRHPSFSNEERYRIMLSKYQNDFISDALETGHFILKEDGIKVAIRTLSQNVSVIAGFIFEAYTVRIANNNPNFGYKLFKWSTERKRLTESYYEKYHTVGVGFPKTDANFPGYYNPTLRQFDILFLTMNEKIGRPEPATIVGTTIPAGVQIKAITCNELKDIIHPLIAGQYSKVITYLRHLTGEHSYEVCMKEIKKLHRSGEITEDMKLKLEDSIAYPEMFGLDQRSVDDYYSFIKAWYFLRAKEDAFILKAIGIQSQEMKNGSSFLTSL